MIVLSTTAVPDYVRGSLTRWLTEPAPGLYVGTVSARVRDELWKAVTEAVGDGAAVLVHPATTEQGFTIKTAGERRRRIADFDGLQLVRFLPQDLDEAQDTQPSAEGAPDARK
ncbi:CRISPR-associated endoribonuclease Cas2 [Actinomadura sp. RB99]|uniref:type I-E CRISPR-associated endoribonuclease Cas2e n=1 Tax=Actinomadura sp. RB99 TaxID=2691577 RepID=UPI00188DE847|nr:type I-E CRISPR-associated endoribonuclease Cas2e [Actinomadura sp. RB99]MBD2895640.1 CRISPR-associated endoribonuclease Cas2 [Actinomadura sp. RB99]